MLAAMSIPLLLIRLAGCALSVFLTALYSGAETGLYTLNLLRLRLSAQKGRRSANILQHLMADANALLAVTLIGTNAAVYLGPVCGTAIFLDAGFTGSQAELYTTLILTPIVFIFGEVVPKNLFQRHAERFMSRVAGLLAGTTWLLRWTGALWLQDRLTGLWTRRLGKQAAPAGGILNRMRIYQLLHEGAAEAALSGSQMRMLERISAFRSIRVQSVMVPRAATVMLPATKTREAIEQMARSIDHSRFPVYRGSQRRVVGIVHLLNILTAEPGTPVSTVMAAPIEVAGNASVRDALLLLQRGRRRMAVVTDRAGDCIGIVTVKDLVEQIIGELAAW